MRGFATKPRSAEEFEAGRLAVRFGVAAGTVEQFADALDCTAERFLDAVEESAVAVVNDTAHTKGRGKDRPRPTDPAKRSIALRVDALREVAAVVGAEEALNQGDAAGRNGPVDAGLERP